MKPWSTWFPDVLPHTPSCPGIMAGNEIAAAARQFFRDSRAWKATLDPISLDAGEPNVQVFPDESATAIVRIESVALGSAALTVLTLPEAMRSHSADWATQTGVPVSITMMTPATLRVIPYPASAVTDLLSLTVTLRPSDSAVGLPDELYAAFRDAIANGARGKLLAMPDKPWTNLQLGTMYLNNFEQAIASARAGADTGYGKARIPGRPGWC